MIIREHINYDISVHDALKSVRFHLKQVAGVNSWQPELHQARMNLSPAMISKAPLPRKDPFIARAPTWS